MKYLLCSRSVEHEGMVMNGQINVFYPLNHSFVNPQFRIPLVQMHCVQLINHQSNSYKIKVQTIQYPAFNLTKGRRNNYCQICSRTSDPFAEFCGNIRKCRCFLLAESGSSGIVRQLLFADVCGHRFEPSPLFADISAISRCFFMLSLSNNNIFWQEDNRGLYPAKPGVHQYIPPLGLTTTQRQDKFYFKKDLIYFTTNLNIFPRAVK